MENKTQEIRAELYRALVLLGAKSDLLGTIGSWGESLPDEDVLSDLRAWNEATATATKERIEHYEISGRRPAYSQGEQRRTA